MPTPDDERSAREKLDELQAFARGDAEAFAPLERLLAALRDRSREDETFDSEAIWGTVETWIHGHAQPGEAPEPPGR